KHGGSANLANDMTVPENTTRPADPDVCDYRIQGTEFDPIFGPGERENFVSLQYVLKRLLPNPTLISEDFNSGSWNPSHFEIGSPTGGVVNGAYRSTGGGDDRGTLRTVENFVPTAEK